MFGLFGGKYLTGIVSLRNINAVSSSLFDWISHPRKIDTDMKKVAITLLGRVDLHHIRNFIGGDETDADLTDRSAARRCYGRFVSLVRLTNLIEVFNELLTSETNAVIFDDDSVGIGFDRNIYTNRIRVVGVID